MSNIEKAMFAPSKVLTDEQVLELPFPMLVSKKLDGIRCIVHPTHGVIAGRSFKPIPNDYIRECLNKPEYVGLDGELITYDPQTHIVNDFNTIGGDVRRKAGKPRFIFHVFDDFTNPSQPFGWRTHKAKTRLRLPFAQYVNHFNVADGDAALRVCRQFLSLGHEGGMFRDPHAPYKEGRATFKQASLLKYKVFEDTEGIIIKAEQLYSKADGKFKPELGAYILGGPWGEVSCGSGFTKSQREDLWSTRLEDIGKVVRFKYQPEPYGKQDYKPRFPIFQGFRIKEDML